ncbi:MAG: NAD kinase [Bacteroidales bacterium]|jgi:NAD+ kinase|nr:NAD kinase [Bacteroidales bacterium]
MKTILFGKKTDNTNIKQIQQLVDLLYQYSSKLFVPKEIYYALSDEIVFPKQVHLIEQLDEMEEAADFLISIGGDGTLLDALSVIKSSGLPILGINTGRLGFLSSVNIEQAEEAFKLLRKRKYIIEKRMLLHLHPDLITGEDHALNDICIQRIYGSGSMITIDVTVNQEYMNTYWCDGLIIATPTGSTAYSLGCGGPIIVPNAEVFVLTPIASHSLTVRPVVIPSDSEIGIKVSSRNQQFLLSVDSSSAIVHTDTPITITKGSFSINIILLKNQSFYKTIRKKLLWGLDKRKG